MCPLQRSALATMTAAIDAACAHAQQQQRDINRMITPEVKQQMVGGARSPPACLIEGCEFAPEVITCLITPDGQAADGAWCT